MVVEVVQDASSSGCGGRHEVKTSVDDTKSSQRTHRIEYGDRTGICLGTDMTISAYYFGILKLLCTHFEDYN